MFRRFRHPAVIQTLATAAVINYLQLDYDNVIIYMFNRAKVLMIAFDPSTFQERPNGPLKPDFIARMFTLKNKLGLSYAALAEPSGLSGAFFHHLMNKKGNVGTQHVAKIAAAVEQFEAGKAQLTVAAPPATVAHTFHLRPDMQVVLHLPGDLSSKEADRLAKFISALPLA